MPKVSIIINCYNGEEFLPAALESVKAQTFDDYDIIFFDNCSTDSSAEIAKSYGGKLKYYCNSTNVSLGRARNLALALADGEYIAFLDCDDLWEPQKLALQTTILDEDESCGIVFSNFYKLNMLSGKKTAFDKIADGIKEIDFETFVVNYSYCLSSFLIRKSILDKLQFHFDERLSFAEEFDLFIRMANFCKVIYQLVPLSYYRIHGSMTSKKLLAQIPDEYDITLNNLTEVIPNLNTAYPKIYKRIRYIRDFSKAKFYLSQGENKKARECVAHFKFYNIRLFCYYIVSFLPKKFSKAIFNKFYAKKI